jgi:hypothetical protein
VRLQFMPRLAVGVIVMAVTVALIYGFVDSKCVQLGQEIRKHEIKYTTLENERVREAARWDEKKTPEKLERAMLQHGLAMNYATAEQVVRMDADGRPVAGQISLAKHQRNRSAIERVVRSGQR